MGVRELKRRNFFGPHPDGPESRRLPSLVDVRQASTLLHLSEWSVYALARQNKVPHYRIGGKLLFSEAKLAAWLERQSHGDDRAVVERINQN